MIYTIEEIEENQRKQKKRSKKIRIIVYIILIPILICNIILIIQSAIQPKETPELVGIKSYVIISGSMQPELNIGDIVIVKKVEDLQEGDIIVPDNKPDIEKILRTSGNVVIDSTNIADGRLNYRGHIALDCLYLSKGENKKLH